MDFGLLCKNDKGEYVVLDGVRMAYIRPSSLVYLLVYVSTYCVHTDVPFIESPRLSFVEQTRKNYHKIAWVAEIAASQIVADRKGNAFIVEKIVKNCYAFYYFHC